MSGLRCSNLENNEVILSLSLLNIETINKKQVVSISETKFDDFYH